jgi:ferritin-like metal-binding protein YciE
MESLAQLFEETVRDIYYAEKKILKALPKMGQNAGSPNLATAFEMHIAETDAQVERLEEVFELIGNAPRGKTCPAIDGILEEGEEIKKDANDDTVRDAGMLAAAQAAMSSPAMARYPDKCVIPIFASRLAGYCSSTGYS